jgi:hypothetical protein
VGRAFSKRQERKAERLYAGVVLAGVEIAEEFLPIGFSTYGRRWFFRFKGTTAGPYMSRGEAVKVAKKLLEA